MGIDQKMISLLIALGLASNVSAYFNTTCNALDLSQQCEDGCNTDLNFCMASAGGDYDNLHACLRVHETCFENCPCHIMCPWGCPCEPKVNDDGSDGFVWECIFNCRDSHEQAAKECKDICAAEACICLDRCDAFDSECTLDCTESAYKCHKKCPCGPDCLDGCPCDNYCNANANQTALIISRYEPQNKPHLFKWVVEEHDETIVYDDGIHHHTRGACYVTYQGEMLVIGGADSQNLLATENQISKVGACGLEKTGLYLPGLESTEGGDIGWTGHSCATINYDTVDDYIIMCSPVRPVTSRNQCYFAHVNPATGKFEFHQNSASTMKDGHADGAMVNWRNRAVIIGGINEEHPDGIHDDMLDIPTNTVEYLTPSFNSDKDWTKMADYPMRIKLHSAVAYNRWIYVFGGFYSSEAGQLEKFATLEVHRYYETTASWTKEPNLQVARAAHTSIWTDQRTVLHIGGYNQMKAGLPMEKWQNTEKNLLNSNGDYKPPVFLNRLLSETILLDYNFPIAFMVSNQYGKLCEDSKPVLF